MRNVYLALVTPLAQADFVPSNLNCQARLDDQTVAMTSTNNGETYDTAIDDANFLVMSFPGGRFDVSIYVNYKLGSDVEGLSLSSGKLEVHNSFTDYKTLKSRLASVTCN